MKKLTFISFMIISCVTSIYAQETTTEQPTEPKPKYWHCNGILSLNASATTMWNWAAGGNNNATAVASANVTLLYKKDAIAWESNLDTEIGVTYLDTEFKPWRKSNDKFNFNTKFGWEFHNQLFLTASAGFKSQYAKGYSYGDDSMTPVSAWLSPSYTDISVGLDYKPNEIFSLYFSPVAGKISTCTQDSLPNAGSLKGTKNALRPIYGIDEDKTFRAELGLSAKFGINFCRVKNLKIISTVGIFTPYTWNAQKDEEGNVLMKDGKKVLEPRHFGNFDVDWDFSISYQFLKVLNVSLNTSLKYYPGILIADKNDIMKERVQFKSILGLGIGYSF